MPKNSTLVLALSLFCVNDNLTISNKAKPFFFSFSCIFFLTTNGSSVRYHFFDKLSFSDAFTEIIG